MPLHFFILDFDDFLVRFLGLEILSRILAFFPIILQKMQKLNYPLIDKTPKLIGNKITDEYPDQVKLNTTLPETNQT